MAPKGMQSAETRSNWEGEITRRGWFKFVTPAPKHDSTVQGKKTKKNHSTPKNTKKTNSRPNRAVWTVFVNCAHWRGSTVAIYKTVLITFPFNLQTITITLDVVKWTGGGTP